MRTLRWVVAGLGVIPVITGAASVAFGSSIVPDGEATPASVESELRFYAAWWIGAGLLLIWLAPRLQERVAEFRGVCAVLFLGGLGRAVAVATGGTPHWWFLVLMGIELALAPVLLVWHACALRAAAANGGERSTPPV